MHGTCTPTAIKRLAYLGPGISAAEGCSPFLSMGSPLTVSRAFSVKKPPHKYLELLRKTET